MHVMLIIKLYVWVKPYFLLYLKLSSSDRKLFYLSGLSKIYFYEHRMFQSYIVMKQEDRKAQSLRNNGYIQASFAHQYYKMP